MKEHKPKIKKIHNEKNIKASSVMLIVLSFVLTIALFFGLIILQNKFSQEIVYQPVLVAKIDIPAKTIITQENINKYFTTKQINILDITSGDLSSADNLIGRQAIVDLIAGENVMLKDFEEISIYTKMLKNPIEISIPLGSIENSDGGKIRTGDIINITMMYSTNQLKSGTNTIDMKQNIPNNITVVEDESEEEDTNSYEYNVIEVPQMNTETEQDKNVQTSEYNYSLWSNYVFKNLYVCKALDESGIEINPTDTDTATAIIIVKVEQEMEREINNALLNCSNMRVSKVLNKTNALKESSNEENISEIIPSKEGSDIDIIEETSSEINPDIMDETPTYIEEDEVIEASETENISE